MKVNEFLLNVLNRLHFVCNAQWAISVIFDKATFLTQPTLKVIWSIGKGLEIFREYSHLFDFHLKAYYVCV